jgi:small subunit ribosomal protein S1
MAENVLDPSDERVEGLDEGWWSAILAEEPYFIETNRDPDAKPAVENPETEIDWTQAQQLFAADCTVSLVVQGCNRGGLLVSGDRIQGFVPVSHLIDMPTLASESERKRILSSLVGKSVRLKVIECDPVQERIVFSERAARMGNGRRNELFNSLQPGKVVTGSITNVTDFGAFVDLGGLEGLIHVSELSWGRVQHPSEIVHVGDSVQVLILQVAEECSRVALSIKRLTPNPWETLDDHYRPGDIVLATITTISRFGVFAKLEEGVEGLIHISSIHFSPGVNSIHDILCIGDTVQVSIIHMDIERRRLGLRLVTTS